MSIWPLVFTIGVYLSLLACLFACVRIAIDEKSWLTGLLQFVMLVAFAILHWLLESWAQFVAPFYSYVQQGFWDMVPYFDFSSLGFAPPEDPCAQALGTKISATIPISGAILCFCLMWTARLLLSPTGWLQPYRPVIAPFMVAFVAVVLDAYLDPVIAISVNCEATPSVMHPGVGFWTWHTEPRFADVWFSVPLFNFASWSAFPATMVAAALLLGWAATAILTSSLVSVTDGLLRFVILLALLAVSITAPGADLPDVQIAFIALLIIVSFYIVWNDRATYKTDNAWRWEFVLPMLFYLLFPLGALFFSGVFVVTGSLALVLVSLLGFAIGLAFVIWPYMKW